MLPSPLQLILRLRRVPAGRQASADRLGLRRAAVTDGTGTGFWNGHSHLPWSRNGSRGYPSVPSRKTPAIDAGSARGDARNRWMAAEQAGAERHPPGFRCRRRSPGDKPTRSSGHGVDHMRTSTRDAASFTHRCARGNRPSGRTSKRQLSGPRRQPRTHRSVDARLADRGRGRASATHRRRKTMRTTP